MFPKMSKAFFSHQIGWFPNDAKISTANAKTEALTN